MAAEAPLVYLFATLLVVSAALLLFTPLLRHTWYFGTSRAGMLALVVGMLVAGVGAAVLVQASLTNPVYFVPVVAVAVGLRLSSPMLLYLRVRDLYEASPTWGTMQIGLLAAFLGLAAIVVIQLTGVLPGITPAFVLVLSQEVFMALGGAALFVRIVLRVRPRGPWSPWPVWISALLFGVAFLLLVPFAFPGFATVFAASGLGGWLVGATILWRDR